MNRSSILIRNRSSSFPTKSTTKHIIWVTEVKNSSGNSLGYYLMFLLTLLLRKQQKTTVHSLTQRINQKTLFNMLRPKMCRYRTKLDLRTDWGFDFFMRFSFRSFSIEVSNFELEDDARYIMLVRVHFWLSAAGFLLTFSNSFCRLHLWQKC